MQRINALDWTTSTLEARAFPVSSHSSTKDGATILASTRQTNTANSGARQGFSPTQSSLQVHLTGATAVKRVKSDTCLNTSQVTTNLVLKC